MTPIGIQEHFSLLNNVDAHVIELTPHVFVVVFDIDKVVTTLSPAVVDAHSM
jgi:hypothetical protein